MQIFEKRLSDTDSIYCLKPTSSHQSSIFVGPTDGEVCRALFGNNYVTDMAVKIELSRDNLMLNALHHYLDGTKYTKRGSDEKWDFSKNWLWEKQLSLSKAFGGTTACFEAAVNKETTRTYLKGVTSLKANGGSGVSCIDLRHYLFSSDVLLMTKKPNGVISIAVAERGGDEFLKGHEEKKATEAKKDPLSVALKVFAEKRGGEWLEEGREVNARVREWFGAMTEEKIAVFDETKIAEMFVGVRDADGKIAFNPMWSGTTGQGWGNIKPETPEQTKEIVQFLLRLRKDASVAALFLDKGFERPKGFGPAVVSELLMKFHPETCFKHGGVTRDVLKTLGLATFAADAGNNFTSDEYKEVCGVAARIRAKMQTMKLPRSVASDGAGDGQPPDYLTVNEFVWFVSKYQKEIENEVMKMKLKTPTHEIKAGKMTLKEVLAKSDTDGAHNDLMTRLVVALLTKPFAILSGVSGTGKSRMVRKLAYMTCNSQELQPSAAEKKPIGNFCMVQVKPNWHDSSDLLGYRSAISDGKYVSTDFVRFVLKAHAFPETPFFVCLDEMNLAPVEHYFAEFLSASESGRGKGADYVTDPIVNPGDFAHDVANLDPQEYAIDDERRKMIEKIGLYLPSNLFVVGTVNMDDTTGGFSRKVLDRAMTIEMNEVKFAELKKNSELNIDDLLLSQEEIAKFLEKREVKENDLDADFEKRLEEIRKDLEPTPLAFAYRFARECLLYRKALAALFPEEMGWKDGATEEEKEAKRKVQSDFALDQLFLMKILPRLVGSVTERDGAMKTLEAFFGKLEGEGKDGKKHDLSKKKLEQMKHAADGNGGYLSYWL